MSKKALKLALEFVNDIRRGKYKGDAEEISTAIKQALEQPVQESLSFNCSAGCGACGVKLQDFVTHQTQSQEGDEWVVVGTQPQIVSTCCGSPVEVWDKRKQDITASVEATPPAAAVQPVAMRMPKVGDRVVCIDDESLGTVVYLTAGGSPEIKFDDGSHGTYMLREFAELFGYTTPPAQEFICSTGLCHYKPATQRQWVGLTHDEYDAICDKHSAMSDFDFLADIEAKFKEKNT
jgi:ferredoxin